MEPLCSYLWGPAEASIAGGQARYVVLTSPQTTLPSGGALSLGLIAVARQLPGVKVLLFGALIAAVGFFVDESSTVRTLHCARGNNRGSQGAMWSLRFQISVLHQPDHKPGSSARAGDVAWPQGAGRTGRCQALCPRAAVWLAGPGLSLWNALNLRLTLPVPLKCGVLDSGFLWGWGWGWGWGGREPSKSLITDSLYEALPSAHLLFPGVPSAGSNL